MAVNNIQAVSGPLDHHGLVSYIKQESLASPDKEEEVPFQAGVKRGKVFVATLTEEEQADVKKKAEIAEKVKLEADEEEALAGASLTDVMALADILNTNPQNFIMEAYSDPMQYYEPDAPNDTNPEVKSLYIYMYRVSQYIYIYILYMYIIYV